jgi:mono/diheme cytochrome c family protein
MSLVLKIVVGIVAVVLIVIIAMFVYVNNFLPDVQPAQDMQIEPTPERFVRGEYLANHVTVCIDCHSNRDWTYYSGPVKPGTEGGGGERFSEEMGLPGTFFSPNITPADVGDWTDGELYRAITTGVDKDGEPLFNLMPYQEYASMDPEDVRALIVYIRSLAAIENEVPESEINFPVNLLIRTVPQDVSEAKMPSPSDSVAFGEYLATIAGCIYCHTPNEKGVKLTEFHLGGGFEFGFPDGYVLSSPNITPDEKTGIGTWTKEAFIKRFKQYQLERSEMNPLHPGAYNTVMPWTMYAGMTEADLGAIYAYLKTQTALKREIVRYAQAH